MKTKILQQYMMRFLLIGVFILLVNCQKEDQSINTIHAVESNLKIKKTSQFKIQDQPEVRKKINEIESRIRLEKQTQSKDVYFEDYDFRINTNDCTYIENDDGSYHSYTFPLYRTNNDNLLENLLISLQPDGSYKAFLVTYFFSEHQKEQLLNNQEIIGNYDFSFSDLENISFDTIFDKTTFNEQTGCWESSTTYHTNPEGSWEYEGYCPHPNGYCSVTTITSVFGCHNSGGGGLSGNNDNDEGYNGNPGSNSNNGLSDVTSPTPCTRNCPEENDCPEINSTIDAQLTTLLGVGNFEYDCSLPNDKMIHFNSVEGFELFLDNLTSSNTFNESSEIDDQTGTLREDIVSVRFNNFPRADIVTTLRVMVPDDNNSLECLDVLNMRTNLDGNNTLFDWTQLSSENPLEHNGPFVDIDEELDRIKVSVQGEIQFGIKIGPYPVKTRYLLTIIITYIYSTGELNPQYCYWIFTN